MEYDGVHAHWHGQQSLGITVTLVHRRLLLTILQCHVWTRVPVPFKQATLQAMSDSVPQTHHAKLPLHDCAWITGHVHALYTRMDTERGRHTSRDFFFFFFRAGALAKVSVRAAWDLGYVLPRCA